MNTEAIRYVTDHSRQVRATQSVIVEIRGRNGGDDLRSLFSGQKYEVLYHTRDDRLDEIIDAAERLREQADCVICCRLLEHTLRVRTLINHVAAVVLRQGGRLIVTCAGRGHRQYVAVDSDQPGTGQYYQDVGLMLLLTILAELDMTTGRPVWSSFGLSVSPATREVFFNATKS